MSRYQEICGCIHIHFPLSLGTRYIRYIGDEGSAAGVDFLIITSHTPRKNPERTSHLFSHGGYFDRTLVIMAEEVDDDRKRESHALILGLKDWAGRKTGFREVFRQVQAQGGLAFMAHPTGRHRLFVLPTNHRWSEWAVEELTGLEVWSLLFDWAPRTHWANMPARYARFLENLEGPGAANLSLWDKSAAGKKTVGIAGLDIHRVPVPCLDIARKFRYRRVFGSLRNHLLIGKPLTGDVRDDEALILDCLRRGNLFFANDRLGDSRGFYFGSADRRFLMGDDISGGIEAEVSVPVKSSVRLLRNGRLVWEEEIVSRRIPVKEPGVYRVEVHRDGHPWIYANPLYAKM